jgi:hypothetical protein
MTSERRKSIIILTVTLLVGILLGILVPGFIDKWERHGKHEDREHEEHDERKKEWFAGTLNKIIKPDKAQAAKIKPIAEWAAVEIDSLENRANHRMTVILDSVKIQLKPILTPDQQHRLDKFDAKAKKSWVREGKRRH